MKRLLIGIAALTITTGLYSQGKIIKEIRKEVTRQEGEAHLTFLASDELRGRGTGSPEIAIAANYLAAQFKISGLKTAGGAPNYFQEVGLWETLPPKKVDFKFGDEIFSVMDDLVLINGKSLSVEGEIVFVGFGNASDFNEIDIRGKIVVTYAGTTETSSLGEAYRKDGIDKYKRVLEKGGAALIEILNFQAAPWSLVTGFLGGPRIDLTGDQADAGDMPHVWARKSERMSNLILQKNSHGGLTVEATVPRAIPGKNIIGVVEGTDPKLKHEYVVLSAHYDHLGVSRNETPDSIYNGARDNAIGTTAILAAAKFLSRNPVKRSILVIAFCAEEKGLLGSRWYADHPLIPLNQTVYDLDCDGAGYNDKTIASLVDLNRTTADDLLTKACLAFGLGLKGDPAPDQNLYERSDNYNFARKGVPAVDMSPGVKGLDPEILQYYHQPADEASSLDFDYLEKFFRAYVYSAYLIGNAPLRPTWKAGDKFEDTGRKLYGIK